LSFEIIGLSIFPNNTDDAIFPEKNRVKPLRTTLNGALALEFRNRIHVNVVPFHEANSLRLKAYKD
jgi:hypothetical protein